MTQTPVYLALGANLGDRPGQLAQALTLLTDVRLRPIRRSALYLSAPQGPVADQPPFLNAVALLCCQLEPRALLARCQAVERQLGRPGATLKGPRTIDLDILLYGELVAAWPELVIPHPELGQRAFVLLPLLELDPELVDPRDGKPLSRHLRQLRGGQDISIWSDK